MPYLRDVFSLWGATDSEVAFCWLLNELEQRFSQRPDEPELASAIWICCQQLRGMGVFNMLLTRWGAGDRLLLNKSVLADPWLRAVWRGNAAG